jgi:hypothetical protein
MMDRMDRMYKSANVGTSQRMYAQVSECMHWANYCTWSLLTGLITALGAYSLG